MAGLKQQATLRTAPLAAIARSAHCQPQKFAVPTQKHQISRCTLNGSSEHSGVRLVSLANQVKY